MPNSTKNKPQLYVIRSRYHEKPVYLISLSKDKPQWAWQRYRQERATMKVIEADSYTEACIYAQKWFGVGIGGSRK